MRIKQFLATVNIEKSYSNLSFIIRELNILFHVMEWGKHFMNASNSEYAFTILIFYLREIENKININSRSGI